MDKVSEQEKRDQKNEQMDSIIFRETLLSGGKCGNNLSSVIVPQCTKIVVIRALIRAVCVRLLASNSYFTISRRCSSMRFRCSSMRRWISPLAHRSSSLRADEAQRSRALSLAGGRVSNATRFYRRYPTSWRFVFFPLPQIRNIKRSRRGESRKKRLALDNSSETLYTRETGIFRSLDVSSVRLTES